MVQLCDVQPAPVQCLLRGVAGWLTWGKSVTLHQCKEKPDFASPRMGLSGSSAQMEGYQDKLVEANGEKHLYNTKKEVGQLR